MQMDSYQVWALRTDIYPETDRGMDAMLLGLASEAGECAGKMKKLIRDRGGEVRPQDSEEMMYELGDVLWYVALLADRLGWELSTVAQSNLDKLASRQERGTIGGSGDDR